MAERKLTFIKTCELFVSLVQGYYHPSRKAELSRPRAFINAVKLALKCLNDQPPKEQQLEASAAPPIQGDCCTGKAVDPCPLHAQGPAMYEALKRAQPYLRTALSHGVYDHEINQIVFDILEAVENQ